MLGELFAVSEANQLVYASGLQGEGTKPLKNKL